MVGSMLGIFGLFLLVLFGDTLMSNYKHSSPSSSSASAGSSSASPTTASVTAGYKNGTYTATDDYAAPGGEEAITLDITLNNDLVIASTVTPIAHNALSASFQSRFIASYKSYVIGKKINDIKLATVAGSSLTTQGFNNAIGQIEQQAKS